MMGKPQTLLHKEHKVVWGGENKFSRRSLVVWRGHGQGGDNRRTTEWTQTKKESKNKKKVAM